MNIIKVINVSKEFRRIKRVQGLKGSLQSLFNRKYEVIKALDNISFNIDKGEIIGYIGPNGAGKSTTVKMLTGILMPSNGIVEVRGLVPWKNRVENAKHIGVVFGQRTQLWWDIPLGETFNLMRYMYNIPESQYLDNLKLFSDILGVDKFINVPVRQLSLGQRMRGDLCCALLHNPDIVYFDEPTIGLDVIVKENIREFIKEINSKRSTTVLLTTHDMVDIEKICSRIIVIDKGRIMYDGNLAKIKQIYGNEERMDIQFDNVEQNIDEEINALKRIGTVECSQQNSKLNIVYNPNIINSTAILGSLMMRKKVLDFKITEARIEDIIRKMYSQLP